MPTLPIRSSDPRAREPEQIREDFVLFVLAHFWANGYVILNTIKLHRCWAGITNQFHIQTGLRIVGFDYNPNLKRFETLDEAIKGLSKYRLLASMADEKIVLSFNPKISIDLERRAVPKEWEGVRTIFDMVIREYEAASTQ